MERKDYLEKFIEIKNEIIKDIRNILGCERTHIFDDTFYVHYVEGEVGGTEKMTGIEVGKRGEITFLVKKPWQDADIDRVSNETIFGYSDDSFVEILEHLEKEVRERKLSHLKEMVKVHGQTLNFDGEFTFDLVDCGDYIEDCELLAMSLDENGKLVIHDRWQGKEYDNSEKYLPTEVLDRLIKYVEDCVEKRFVVRVSGTFSRCIDVYAKNYDDALAIAKEDWEINPLCYADVNGEDWEDFTARAR